MKWIAASTPNPITPEMSGSNQETVEVSVGRLVGFRRLAELDRWWSDVAGLTPPTALVRHLPRGLPHGRGLREKLRGLWQMVKAVRRRR